ncbi:hypothetical protein ZIOFF_006268 [Zingiber officinale]|uniref:Histone H2A C-terminal domain-containing protein n=1 Tax=Zingiber officinale TaxID=94328 RepID=A0A8J5IBK4_ZINOF|nr:hypothetical protein ZIOFF_006268 [Zingiber officinale]
MQTLPIWHPLSLLFFSGRLASISCDEFDDGGDLVLNLNLHFFIGVDQKSRIILRRIQLPMKNNEEFGKLLACATISNGGGVPNIYQALLPKKQGRGKSKPEIRSSF